MVDVPVNEDDEGMATVATEQKSVTLEQCITAQLRPTPIDIATDTTVNSGSEGPRCVKCTQRRVGCGQLMIQKLAKVMVVELNRFTQAKGGPLIKNCQSISIPLLYDFGSSSTTD
jgi:ubiquitin C-terminal hydrolase